MNFRTALDSNSLQFERKSMQVQQRPQTEMTVSGLRQPAAVHSLADTIAALSYALDITEGQPEGHSTRSCLIAMRLAEEVNLPDDLRASLFYGTLLKDSGCSSNAAKVCTLFGADDRAVKMSFKLEDLTNRVNALGYMVRQVAPDQSPMVRAAKLLSIMGQPNAGKDLMRTRCARGAAIAKKLGFCDEVASTVAALDEHWDGRGEPLGIRGEEIPLLARIACLSQTVEVYFRTYGLIPALDVAIERSGRWFDPDLVDALISTATDYRFWSTIDESDVRSILAEFKPYDNQILVDEDRLDAIAEGFADVIDAKSPWTSRHSFGVAEAMVGILEQMGYSATLTRYWRRAALLHDIGKLGVSNLILDKPGKLTDEEFAQVKLHVDYTHRILSLVPSFRDFASDAAAHHEKLDGSGYNCGLTAEELSPEARALCVADIFDALSSRRPYRKETISLDRVFEIMGADVGHKICPIAFNALRSWVDRKEPDIQPA